MLRYAVERPLDLVYPLESGSQPGIYLGIEHYVRGRAGSESSSRGGQQLGRHGDAVTGYAEDMTREVERFGCWGKPEESG